jgi:hypothetical protein
MKPNNAIDLDPFLRHNERAIEQGKITDRAVAILADRE